VPEYDRQRKTVAGSGKTGRARTLKPAQICAVLLALAIRTAFAATYYVSPSGSDSGTGASSSPFRTINYGAGLLKPGDTLLLRGGIYAEELDDVTPGGTSWSNAVTFAAYPGEKPVIQPTSSASHVVDSMA
jgi:hypothetical protein